MSDESLLFMADGGGTESVRRNILSVKTLVKKRSDDTKESVNKISRKVTDARDGAKGFAGKVVTDVKHTAKGVVDKATDTLNNKGTEFSSKKDEITLKMEGPGFRTAMSEKNIVMYPDIPEGSLLMVPLHSQEDLEEIARLSNMSFRALEDEYGPHSGELVTEIDVIIKHNEGSMENAIKDIASMIVSGKIVQFDGKLTHVLCQVIDGSIHPFFGIDPKLLSNVYIFPLLKPTDDICGKVNGKGLFKKIRDDNVLEDYVCPGKGDDVSPSVSPPVSPLVSPPVSPPSGPTWTIETQDSKNFLYAQKLLKKMTDADTDTLKLITAENIHSIGCMVENHIKDLLDMTIQPVITLKRIAGYEDFVSKDLVESIKVDITTMIGDDKDNNQSATGYFLSLENSLKDPKPLAGEFRWCSQPVVSGPKLEQMVTDLGKLLRVPNLFYNTNNTLSFLGIDEEWRDMYEELKGGLDAIIAQMTDYDEHVSEYKLRQQENILKNKEIDVKIEWIEQQRGKITEAVTEAVTEIKERRNAIIELEPPSMDLSDTRRDFVNNILENIGQVGGMNRIRSLIGAPRPPPQYATEETIQTYIDFIKKESLEIHGQQGKVNELTELSQVLLDLATPGSDMPMIAPADAATITASKDEGSAGLVDATPVKDEGITILVDKLKAIIPNIWKELETLYSQSAELEQLVGQLVEKNHLVEKDQLTKQKVMELCESHDDHIENIRGIKEEIIKSLEFVSLDDFYSQFIGKSRLVFGDAYIGLDDFLSHIPEMGGGRMKKVKSNNKRSNNNRKRTNRKRTNRKRTNRKRTNRKRSNRKRSNRKRTNRKRTNRKRIYTFEHLKRRIFK